MCKSFYSKWRVIEDFKAAEEHESVCFRKKILAEIRSSEAVQDTRVCGKNELLMKETVLEHAGDSPVAALHSFLGSRHFSQDHGFLK